MEDEHNNDSSDLDNVQLTIDHDIVREWAEAHDAVPVRKTADNETGTTDLTLVARDEVDDSLRELSWEAFFEAFEKETLALLYSSDVDDELTAAELVDREGHYR